MPGREIGGGLDQGSNSCGGAEQGFGSGFEGMVQPVGCAADRWRTRSDREESSNAGMEPPLASLVESFRQSLKYHLL